MKFLVAIDGSQVSQLALQRAIDLALPSQSTVLIMTAIEPLSSYLPSLMLPTGDWVTLQGTPNFEMEKMMTSTATQLLTKAESHCQEAGVACETRMETGTPRDVICNLASAEAVDFLFIGSRGLGTVERLMLGSVSDYVVHHATCPVVVVR